jgi:tetratricopeptide (TPR) repeat protein
MWFPLPDRKVFLCLLFLCSALLARAQELTIDSLKQMMEAEEYEQVLSVSENQLKTVGDPLRQVQLLALKADAFYFLNKLPESLQTFLEAVDKAEKSEVDDILLLIECNSHAAFCYSELGVFRKALDYYLKALDYALVSNDSVELATAYYNVGTSYRKLEDFTNAIEYANKAYTIDLIRKDTAALAFDLNHMGSLSEENGNYTKAIQLYKESIQLHEKGGGNINSIAGRLNSIGMAFRRMNMLDSALFYVEKSLLAHQKTKDSINIAERWVSLASIYNHQKKYGEARKLVQQAMTFYEGLDESEQLATARLTLAENYLMTGQFDVAEKLVSQNILYCQQLGLLAQLKNSYLLYSRIMEYSGRYMEALNTYKQFTSLEDSLFTLQNRKAISELNIMYDVDSKEQQNKILQLENEVQLSQIGQQQVREKWLVISIVVIFLSLVAITLALTSRYKAKQLQLEAEVNEMRTKIKVVLNQDTQALSMQLDDINQRLAQPLSEREFEILTHALSNLNNSEIAEKVFVSVNTVKYHLKNIYEKLGVTNRKEAMQFALNQSKE